MSLRACGNWPLSGRICLVRSSPKSSRAHGLAPGTKKTSRFSSLPVRPNWFRQGSTCWQRWANSWPARSCDGPRHHRICKEHATIESLLALLLMDIVPGTLHVSKLSLPASEAQLDPRHVQSPSSRPERASVCFALAWTLANSWISFVASLKGTPLWRRYATEWVKGCEGRSTSCDCKRHKTLGAAGKHKPVSAWKVLWYAIRPLFWCLACHGFTATVRHQVL